MLYLTIRAPFAAFRTFTARWYRPTAGFLTPSAAYGLALNLAGIETRRDDGLSAMTVTRFGLPRARIALGVAGDEPLPTAQTVFQQLHNYPVGASGKDRKEGAKGNKYNITPVRREFLADLHAIIALDFHDNPDIEDQIRRGLRGEPPTEPRYGLPFLGDNAFLIDRIEIGSGPIAARWFRRLGTGDEAETSRESMRLTIWVDRQDMSKTQSALFSPDPRPSDQIPPSAWTAIEPPAAPRPSKK